MLGALIGLGASLISGFGAKKQREKENRAAQAAADKMNADVRARAEAAAAKPITTENTVDMAGFMKAAEDHGFNPLTFLRSGALSLFTKSSVNGSMNMEAALAGQYIPQMSSVPSTGEILGGALSSALAGFQNDRAQQAQNKFSMDLVNAQLKGAGFNGSSSASRSFNVPSAVLSGPSRSSSGSGALASTQLTKASPFRAPGDALCMFGVCMPTHGGTSSGEDFETRHGDFWGSIFATAPVVADTWKGLGLVNSKVAADPFGVVSRIGNAVGDWATSDIRPGSPADFIVNGPGFGRRSGPGQPATGVGAMWEDATEALGLSW